MINQSIVDLQRVKMYSKEANLLQQIDESRKAIRQKHLQLKHGIQETEN